MPAYLVRLVGSRDLLGFYCADEPDNLLTIIDEITDPDDCEYTELPDGGIAWESPAIEVPVEDDNDSDSDENTPDIPFAQASLSESWWSVVYGSTDAEWTPFFPDKPVAAGPPKPRRPLGPGRVIRFGRRKA